MVSSLTPGTDTPKIDRSDWHRPARWAKGYPWKPKIPEDQRAELAQQWLESLGMEPTEDMTEKINPHVMLHHPLSLKGQLANQIVLSSKKPSQETITRS